MALRKFWILFISLAFLPDSNTFENLAVRKPANQSGTLSPASLAVDGKINQTWPNMAATKFGTSVWWFVDLGITQNIHNITIYYRTDGNPAAYRPRFAGFSLYISNSDQTTRGGYDCGVNSTDPPTIYPAVCMHAGRYVTLYNQRDTSDFKGTGAILELAEVQVFGCPNANTHGSECNKQCSNTCKDRLCNILNGSCFSCADGYQGKNCLPCVAGKYGKDCEKTCSPNCISPLLCDNIDGSCTGGCVPGWRGGTCNEKCNPGSYGQGCVGRCSGNCKNNDACHHITGYCSGGCADGWRNSFCSEKCNPGSYGQGCVGRCSGNCKNNDACHHITGYCSGECADGWRNSFCSEKCLGGYYGRSCSSRCSNNCKNGHICHHVTGTCDQGCKDGYYGLKCLETCSGNCWNNTVCNGLTGACSNGCSPGWETDDCSKACNPGKYGENCALPCGNCRNRTTCDIKSGHCESGCGPGYNGVLCTTECSTGLYGEDCLKNCSGHCLNSESCNVKTGACGTGCAPGYIGEKCDKNCEDRFYGRDCKETCSMNCFENDTCNFINGSCPRGCLKGWVADRCIEEEKLSYVPPKKTDVGPIIGGICGALIAAVVIVVVIFVIRRRKPEKALSSLYQETEHRSNISADQKERMPAAKYHEEGNAYENAAGLHVNQHDVNLSLEENEAEDTYYNTAPKPAEVYKDIKIEDLHNVIQDMLRNEKAAFTAQYEGIFKGEEYPCDAGKKQENIPKNRFKTTFPYDHSRVILRPTSQQTSDYINANYIENIEGDRTYIAAQGPKPNTVVEFWKMVWQENVQKIVMVTNLKEGAKIKCEQYWPDAGQTLKRGELIVKLHEERHYAFYTIRTLKITRNVTKEDRLLYHFHYTQWMDHDVPDSLGLVIFHRHVMKTAVQQKNSLTMVHCSAGIGRTGTYIALDALYKNGKKTGKVNIPAYVKVMRKDRMSMIQNVNQYITVFNALEEAFRSTPHAIQRNKFVEEFENQNKPDKPANSKHIRTTFHELRSLRPQYTKNDCQTGRDNLDANYTKSVIPVDKFRCNLYSYSKGRGNYYNAVFMQSYTKRDGLISAQFPLPAYTEDFLRLLHDFESHIVVSVNPLSQIESTSIWMPINHSGLTIGDFNVSLDSQPQTNGTVKSTTVSIKKEGFGNHALQVFESTSWNTRDPLPADPTPVLELVTQTQKALKSLPDGAIVVLSLDGASKCGVFCALFNALQQVHLDDEVDIFTIVRQLQIRRPEMFANMDEYQFCFKAVADHLNEPPEDYDNIYANC